MTGHDRPESLVTMDRNTQLALALDRAKITPAQFSTGVDALFMSMSGLVDEDVIALISDASDIAATIDRTVKRHFIKGAAIVSASRKADDSTVQLVTRLEGRVKTEKTTECASPKAAAAHIETVGELLMKNGYTEI